LKEFHEEDLIYREQELEINDKLKKMDGLSEIQKKKEKMKLIENKSSVFSKEEITKRNFYLQLFRTYSDLPFQETI
jgi:hypothetical protein